MGAFLATLLLLAAIVALCYLYLIWNFGYWKKRGVKEGKTIPFVGSYPSRFTQKRNVAYDADDLYRQYKNDEHFVGVYNCRTPQLLVLSTELAHRVFVNDFKHFYDNEFSNMISKKCDVIMGNNIFTLKGEEWKSRRAEITPGLTANRVSASYPVTQKVVKMFVNYIRSQIRMSPPDGINAKELCLRYTTEVVSDCVLGIQAKSFTDSPTPIFNMIKRVFESSQWFFIYNAICNVLPQLRKVYMARFFQKEVEQFFFELMDTSIDLRRKMGVTDRIDFLNYILQLQEKKHLSTTELTSHTMTFLTDGFETTASVLAHALLLLGRHPDKQEKLRAEMGTSELNYEQLTELHYLDACIHESIRIFSPQLLARKLCTEPYDLVNKNGNTVLLEPGTAVYIPAYSIHHDPDIYADPEDFKPERFLPEHGGVKKYREMGAYLGFGDGPRICIGMRFGLTQVKAATVEILRNFNVKINPKTRKDNCLDDTYFLGSLKGGIWLDFEERK